MTRETRRVSRLRPRSLAGVALLAVLASCGGAPEAPNPDARDIERALSGKTLRNETGARITLGRDGTISGTGVSGTWWVSGTQVCRTLVAPETMTGTTCQRAVFTEDRVAFHSPGGRTLSFEIEN